MSADLTPRLTAWLAATNIDALELRGPGVHLQLRNDRGPAVAAMPVTAASVGVFLHGHPVHDAPLATPGQPAKAGQPIGLLRIGALLLPVVAPHDGSFGAYRVAPGSVVGYGTVLADMIPDPSE